MITPSRFPKPSPVRVDIAGDGRVSLESDNIFDVYAEEAFGADDPEYLNAGAVVGRGDGDDSDPLPWLRLRVVVTEQGSIVYTSRHRRLSIIALPIVAASVADAVPA